MLTFFLWYISVSLIGLAAFPLTFRLLPALPDRGYAFSRALGLLLWGYIFWLSGSLGILGNDLGGQLFALAGLLALSGLALRGGRFASLLAWLKSRRALILRMEGLFLLAFVGMAIVRAANPDLNYTEKPMELAFINAILQSPALPPQDPWLSGYAISYYYFGYLLVAMLARLSGAWGSVAHNLGTALVFGLSALGSYGIVFNLLAIKRSQDTNTEPDDGQNEPAITTQASAKPSTRISFYALLGPFFVLLLSNLEGLLEILYSRHLFWQRGADGKLSSGFWSWLGILDLNQPPSAPPSWLPRSFDTGSWWWWRASRVVSDYNFPWEHKEIIDEFPFFAFLHADLHPHVLVMPFAFLAMSLALNLYLGGGGGELHLPGTRLKWQLDPLSFLLSAVALGGMFLLNAWDFPIYVALAAAAYAIRRVKRETEQAQSGLRSDYILNPSSLILDFLSLSLGLGITGILLYLPFYLGFSSQAGGIIPSLVYFTRGAHLWVMFGSLLIPLGAYLLFLWRGRRPASFIKGTGLAVGFQLGLLVLSVMVAWLSISLGSKAPLGNNATLVSEFGAPDWLSLLRETILRRLSAPGGWITLTLLLGATLGLWLRDKGPLHGDEDKIGGQEQVILGKEPAPSSVPFQNPARPILPAFSLLLILLGALLVIGPEFFYLRDLYGYRINTIFKLYYQAWLLWGVAAAYGSAVLLQWLRGKWAVIYRTALAFVVVAGLIYPFFSLIDKTDGFDPPTGWTLDGGDFLGRQAPDELAAIRWLYAAPAGNIVEGVCPGGGSFLSECARISTFSGRPTVIGWVWHEIQWRGSDDLFRDRQGEVERLYTTRDWTEAQEILDRYDIRYVVVGSRERSVYPRIFESKFERALKPVFRQGEFVIYEVPQ